MKKFVCQPGSAAIHRGFTLAVLLLVPYLAMSAEWTEKPIGSLASVAGTWSGTGKGRDGKEFTEQYTFRQDGSFEYVWHRGSRTGDGKRPPGTIRLNDGKMNWTTEAGKEYTVTLYEGAGGKRKLEGRRNDGTRWTLEGKK